MFGVIGALDGGGLKFYGEARDLPYVRVFIFETVIRLVGNVRAF
jgi:hypothetical protein